MEVDETDADVALADLAVAVLAGAGEVRKERSSARANRLLGKGIEPLPGSGKEGGGG